MFVYEYARSFLEYFYLNNLIGLCLNFHSKFKI